MGLSVKTGSFASGTGAATTTVSVADVGFQPSVVLFWTSASTSGVADDLSFSFGVGISSSSRRSAWAGCLDNTDPSECDCRVRSDAVLMVYRGTTPTDSGTFDFTSMDAGGFTLTVSTQFAADITIFYTALGGTDITNVALTTESKSGTGAFSRSDLGFQPDFLLLFSTRATILNTNSISSAFNIGYTDGTNAALQSVNCDDASATSACGSYVRAAASQLEILALLTSSATVTNRYSFTSFDAGGFTLNKDEATTTDLIFALSIKGGRWNVGGWVAPDTATTFTGASGLAFQPVGVFVTSPPNGGAVQSVSDTGANQSRIGIGFFDGTTQGAAGSSGNTASTTNTAYANGLSATLGYYTAKATDGTALVSGTIDSLDAGGWSGTATVATATERFGTYWVVGANAAAGSDNRRVIMVS